MGGLKRGSALDESLRLSFPSDRWSWFVGVRTWFEGEIEQVDVDSLTVHSVDGFAPREGCLLAVVERAILPCKTSIQPGERVRFEATVIESSPGVYGFAQIDKLVRMDPL